MPMSDPLYRIENETLPNVVGHVYSFAHYGSSYYWTVGTPDYCRNSGYENTEGDAAAAAMRALYHRFGISPNDVTITKVS